MGGRFRQRFGRDQALVLLVTQDARKDGGAFPLPPPPAPSPCRLESLPPRKPPLWCSPERPDRLLSKGEKVSAKIPIRPVIGSTCLMVF